MLSRGRRASIARAMLVLCTPLLACVPTDDQEADDQEGIDVEALRWCIRTPGRGTREDGTEVRIPSTIPEIHACVCLSVGTQPSTGSEWEAELIERGVQHCEDGLHEQGAVTTNCADVVPRQATEYEGACSDPEE